MRRNRQVIGRNVTFNPLATALSVEKPIIHEVLDCDIGEYFDARTWISSHRYEELIAQRIKIQERLSENPRFRCSLCFVPVYLVASQIKHFFFRHTMEDGSCPAKTRSPLSRDEILARKYSGVCESEPHKQIKALIVRSLAGDPCFSGVMSEHQWRSSRDRYSRRQPDVQAVGPMGRVAFEVQLSTTFLDVVAGRRAFYRQEGALLVWIMGGFDPNYRRLTTDDLLFSNNSNILVIDEDTTVLSEGERRFHVRCHYRLPAREGDSLKDQWKTSVVPFSSLTCEKESQRCWYCDYDHKAASLRAVIDQEVHERTKAEAEALRKKILSFPLLVSLNSISNEVAICEWATLQKMLYARNIYFPSTFDDDICFVALLNGVASARKGEPIGWKFERLVQVAHLIADSYPQHVVAFHHAIDFFEQGKLLDQQDRTGKWKRRWGDIVDSLHRGEIKFAPNSATFGLLDFLMPGTKAKLCIIGRSR